MRIQNEWMLQYIENWTKDKLSIALADAQCLSIEVMEQLLLWIVHFSYLIDCDYMRTSTFDSL